MVPTQFTSSCYDTDGILNGSSYHPGIRLNGSAYDPRITLNGASSHPWIGCNGPPHDSKIVILDFSMTLEFVQWIDFL